jgi:hypothetical protein
MGGRKQWVKQQAQEYQDYVHVAETLEALVVAMMVNNDLEYCVQHVIKLIFVIRKTIAKGVVL